MKSVHPYRILLCHTLFPTDQNPKIVGGAERSSLDLALGLWQERGHHVEVLRGLPPGVPARIETLGAIKVHCLPLRRPYWLHDGKPRSSLEKLYWHWSDDHGAVPKGTGALLDEVRPDILLLGNIVGLGWGLMVEAHKRAIPAIQTLHDYYYLCPAMTRFHGGKGCGPVCAALTRRRRRVLPRMDAAVGVSSHILQEHRKAGVVVPGMIAAKIFNGLPPLIAQLCRDEHPVGPVFGYLGRISPEKGIDTLIESLPSGAKLLIAGSMNKSTEAHLLSKIANPEQIQLLGFMKPSELFARIDVLVVPSLWEEPFGRVSIEAQQAGVPVIVSDQGGLPETVADGKSGWVFPAGNTRVLRDIMDQVIASPELRQSMSSNARKFASDFSITKRVLLYDELIDSVFSRSSP